MKYNSMSKAVMVTTILILTGCGRTSDVATHAPSTIGKAITERGNISKKQKTSSKTEAKKTLPEVKVALLLPLTGEASPLGNALLDAAMMGLFDKDAVTPASEKKRQVVLLPKDTENSPEVAAKRAQEAINEGAQLIIGPLFSDDVKVVTPIAKAHNVTLLSFSNNKAVGKDGVFLLGFMPEQQARRVIGEAIMRGKKRIAIIAPNDDLGKMVTAAAHAEATNRGMHIQSESFYDPASKDADIEIAVQKAIGGRNVSEEMKPDAILIPEIGAPLTVILQALKTQGINENNAVLLGTGLWDDNIVKSQAGLRGGWFASAPFAARKGFEARFKKNYGYEPLRLASLAYDAVALAATLANEPQNVSFSSSDFTNPNGFAGPANGIFRCKATGVCERGLSVLTISAAGFEELSPAPRSFEGN